MKNFILPGVVLIVINLCTCVLANSVVAEYKFDRVVDGRTDDSSGNGNSATITGAQPIRGLGGNAMLFDGVDDFIDCGNPPSLDLQKAISIECWVRPDALPKGEPIIVGKRTTVYGLTWCSDGRAYWYITNGGNYVKAGLGIGSWQYVVATYDGSISRMYVNGKLVDSKRLDVPITPGGKFYIGAEGPEPSGQRAMFPGAIGTVRVYDYALPEDIIAKTFKEASTQMLAKVSPVTNGQILKGNGFVLKVGSNGGIQVDVSRERYNLETHLSYPGETIGWNKLGEKSPTQEMRWRPLVKKQKDGSVKITSAGSRYSLVRSIAFSGKKIVVTDTLTNTGRDDVAVFYRNDLAIPKVFKQRLISGLDQTGAHQISENPSVFISQQSSRLGWLAQDSLYRIQLSCASSPNSVSMSTENFALQPGKSHAFRWVIYPMGVSSDYWSFINQVRRDWNVNFRMVGPSSMFYLDNKMGLIRDREALKKYLSRNQLKVVQFVPWLDYDNNNPLTNRPATREEYKALVTEARTAIKSVDPSILCIGCIEANWVSLPEEVRAAINATIPGQAGNQYSFTDEQLAILKKYDLRWNDCLLTNKDGKHRYELYHRGADRFPMIAISVIPEYGNAQHKYWLEQAKYILEDVGLDGLYIDQFNMVLGSVQQYSYNKWDGNTVDVDRLTGQIISRYTDGALVSIKAQQSLEQYVIGKGKYMLANSFPASQETQSLRVHRFCEGEWYFNPSTWKLGEMPPASYAGTQGHLSTPILLGYRVKTGANSEEQNNYAQTMYKVAIAFLRNGILWYHYGTEIPETGAGSGDYGPFNHMFPITPLELHPGWIVGKERIVTAVSGVYKWNDRLKPTVLVFDINGRLTLSNAKLTKTTNGWSVDLKLKDWAEIGVIEK